MLLTGFNNQGEIMKQENKGLPSKGLPLRDDVETVTYHRPPTKAEINIGFGSLHYADFSTEDCCHKGTRIPKKWFISQYDGLRYYKG